MQLPRHVFPEVSPLRQRIRLDKYSLDAKYLMNVSNVCADVLSHVSRAYRFDVYIM